MASDADQKRIAWRSWSTESFEEAKRSKKLVLLDLTASWCHWCHAMDKATYENDDVVKLVNDNFIAIRVDIDRRPDISERYNRGGFPTTSFLSDRGESIWGGTYIPPTDMKRIIGTILRSKSSGEIEQALERSRMLYLDISKGMIPQNPVTSDELNILFEDIFSSYDVSNGGFGIEPKFPHPDVLDILLTRYSEDGDPALAEAVTNTLERMIEGIYDKVEGGFFRYSVTKDWKTPHYEKMLETNLGMLRNLTHAYAVIGSEEFKKHAEGVAKYLLKVLRDPHTGGFYGSQDANEEYYKLSRGKRKTRKPPSVDKTIYAGWNAEAVADLIVCGKVLGKEEWVRAGFKAWRNLMARLWDSDRKLVRHVADEKVFLVEDQASFFNALIAVFEVTGDESLLGLGDELVNALDKDFGSEGGGYQDIVRAGDEIGELDTPRQPLVENSDIAYAMAVYGTIAGRKDLVNRASNILYSFARSTVEDHGLFGAAYLRASWSINGGPITVDVHASPRMFHDPLDLCTSARSYMHPAVVIRRVLDEKASKPFATVCFEEKCLPKTSDPAELRLLLSDLLRKRGALRRTIEVPQYIM